MERLPPRRPPGLLFLALNPTSPRATDPDQLLVVLMAEVVIVSGPGPARRRAAKPRSARGRSGLPLPRRYISVFATRKVREVARYQVNLAVLDTWKQSARNLSTGILGGLFVGAGVHPPAGPCPHL
jgi:hypothetical protein